MSINLENFADKAIKMNAIDPAKRILGATKGQKDIYSKGSTLVGETLKEGALLPVRNAAAISKYIWGKSFSLLGNILGTGASAAMLIPLPLPGARNIAEVRGNLSALKDAIHISASGRNREGFQATFDRLRGKRHDSQSGTTGATAA